MPRYFDDEFLRRLRNDIHWAHLLQQLDWPHKQRHGQLAFLCPRCQEYLSAVNPRTNLGRCFSCETNFNPIDFTMAVRDCDFVTAVAYLKPLLSPRNSGSKPT
jgi:DNA primase